MRASRPCSRMFVEMKGARVNPLLSTPANVRDMIVAFTSISDTRIYTTKQRESPIFGLDADRVMTETRQRYHEEQRMLQMPCGHADDRSLRLSRLMPPAKLPFPIRVDAPLCLPKLGNGIPEKEVTAYTAAERRITRPSASLHSTFHN